MVARRGNSGPLPRYCAACADARRDLQRLRGYLRSALNLATALGLRSVALQAQSAVETLDRAHDGEPRR